MERLQDPAEMPVTSLKGVGQKVAERLQGIGISSVQDVLFHLPSRYQDRTRVRPIGTLRVGEEAVVHVELELADVVIRRRRTLLCRVSDGSGHMTLRFFHFSKAQVATLKRGSLLQCFGEVRRGPSGFEMVHPEYKFIKAGDAPEDSLTPIYPVTEGVNQLTLRKLTDQALVLLEQDTLVDWLPSRFMEPTGFPTLPVALRTVHRPLPTDAIETLLDGSHVAIQRLAFEELLAHRLGMQQQRAKKRDVQSPAMRPPGVLADAFLQRLPFTPTAAQTRVMADIRADLAEPEPMLRLLQGDVGAGKTVVAAIAAAVAVEAGFQVALMAPTEILAEQHLLNFVEWFEPLEVDVGWLSGKLGARQRRDAIEAVALGRSRIVVGTHALFQSDVEFQQLGLAIIDEQHRFGVHQRMSLRDKGRGLMPHQLIMTATPIPRTLAMTAYADLDCSIIDELPPGRKPVTTVAIESDRRGEVVERVSASIQEGRQIYWVCTLIEESDVLQAEAAEDTWQALTEAMPEASVGLVHGRLKPREKELVMQQFKARQIDLLVATTVIEVGVDVPNASLMVIENAERLGLSQLHQLRGRVGRGAEQSSCILLYYSPLSAHAKQRLNIMRSTNDGFVVAEQDLLLRGAGEVLGTRQTGEGEFRIADLVRDATLLDSVAGVADALMSEDPAAVQALVRRWIGAQRPAYASV